MPGLRHPHTFNMMLSITCQQSPGFLSYHCSAFKTSATSSIAAHEALEGPYTLLPCPLMWSALPPSIIST